MRSKLPDSLRRVPDPAPTPADGPADNSAGVSDAASDASDPLHWLTGLEGVPSAYAAARDGIDALLRDRGLRRTSADQTAESLLRGAHASAVLEGSSSALEDLRADSADEVAMASLRLSTVVLGVVPQLAEAPLQAFARLHAVAGKGAVPDEQLGRPVSPDAAQRLQALAGTLRTSRVPALLLAALVHAELATVGAFASHNGLVARAAERAVLVARGVDPASVTVPEAGHLALRAQYESNLRGYRDGGRAGLHAWLLYAPEAYAAGAEASPLRD